MICERLLRIDGGGEPKFRDARWGRNIESVGQTGRSKGTMSRLESEVSFVPLPGKGILVWADR